MTFNDIFCTASALDLKRSNQLENNQAEDVAVQTAAAKYLDRLAVIVGREPGALDDTLGVPGTVPLPPEIVPVGDPARLIAHRPNVRAAERALAAGTAQIGVDKAKLLPAVRFTAPPFASEEASPGTCSTLAGSPP